MSSEVNRISFDELFLRSVNLVNASLPPISSAFQKELTTTVAQLRQALTQRQLNGVLSDNEPFFELHNTQLYSLLLEYHLAVLLPKQTFESSDAKDASDRKKSLTFRVGVLREADVYLNAFLDQLESVELLSAKERKEQLDQVTKRAFTVDRDTKVKRFKQQRDLEEKLKAVEDKKKTLEGEDDRDYDDEEEVEREQIMTYLQLAVVKSMEEQASMNQEKEMLEKMLEMSEQSGDPEVLGDGSRKREPPRQGEGISVTHINPQMEMKRETIRSQVFQPGHRLPTMSLEEYADREVAEAEERQRREQEAPQAPRRYDQLEEDGEEDNIGLVDEAAYRDRAWDDWKDAHPRGEGNKGGSQF